MLLAFNTQASGTCGRYDSQTPSTATSVPTSQYAHSSEDYIDRFYAALNRWRSETHLISSANRKFSHPSFQSIVDLGQVAIPLILSEVRHSPSWLVVALERITGERPYNADMRGNLKAITNAWLSRYEWPSIE